MTAVHDRRPPILRYPPAGSQFAGYVDFIESLGWQQTVPEFRELEARHLLRTEAKWSRHPVDVTREFVLMPLLKKLGMPEGLNGEWFDLLLDCAIARTRDEFLMLEAEEARLPSKTKGGQPPAPPLAQAIVFAASLDASDELGLEVKENRCVTKAAIRLSGTAKGSINRSTVLRAVKASLLEVGDTSSPQQIMFMRVVMSVRIAMAQYDQQHFANGSVRHNSLRKDSYSRTDRIPKLPAFTRRRGV